MLYVVVEALYIWVHFIDDDVDLNNNQMQLYLSDCGTLANGTTILVYTAI